MKLAYPTVSVRHSSLSFVPNSDQPHAALDLIKQVSPDTNGNLVSALVYAYHTKLMNAARLVTSERNYPISLCAKFMEVMDSRL